MLEDASLNGIESMPLHNGGLKYSGIPLELFYKTI